jgi:hypothetical protein
MREYERLIHIAIQRSAVVGCLFGVLITPITFLLILNFLMDTKNKTNYEMVMENHQAFEQEVDSVVFEGSPTMPPSEAYYKWVTFRMRLIREEADELERALLFEYPAQVLKEACDLDYVLKGTLVSLKDMVDPDRGPFREVHEANMSKLDDDGRPIKRADGKYLKSKNYRPADLSRYFEGREL